MSWVRIDDAMPESLKIAPLSDAAFRAYVSSICYAARNLTDGFVPFKKAKEMAGKSRVVQELVPSLWAPVDGGFAIHDYLVYNPDRETVLAERVEKHDAKVRAGQAGAAKRWQGDSRSIAEGVAKPKQNNGPVPVPLPQENDPDRKVIVGEGPLPFEPPPKRTRLPTKTDMDKLAEQFPTLDVPGQWQRAQDWASANGKTYRDYVAFLRNWLRTELTYERNGVKQLGGSGANAGQSRRASGLNGLSPSEKADRQIARR